MNAYYSHPNTVSYNPIFEHLFRMQVVESMSIPAADKISLSFRALLTAEAACDRASSINLARLLQHNSDT